MALAGAKCVLSDIGRMCSCALRYGARDFSGFHTSCKTLRSAHELFTCSGVEEKNSAFGSPFLELSFLYSYSGLSRFSGSQSSPLSKMELVIEVRRNFNLRISL